MRVLKSCAAAMHLPSNIDMITAATTNDPVMSVFISSEGSFGTP